MYQVYIPINGDNFHRAKDKQLFLDELRAFDTNRVMINFETSIDGYVVLYNEEEYQRMLTRMREACAFFKQHGYKVGAWFWGLQFDEQFPFTRIRTLKHRDAKNFACPADPDFLDKFSRCLIDVAKTGVDMILLNDDLRYGNWDGFGCVCERHRRMICEELGEELIDEDRMVELIMNGGKNKYRDAFLRANRRAMETYATVMRRAVDSVDPSIRMGFCACLSSWDIDGDAYELTKLLAGNTKPLLRLIGAPYWSSCEGEGSRLQAIVEMERMEASWNTDPDIELIAEGDAYPRPRLNCAACYLEGFDTAIRASGALDGILRICIDGISKVGYETGYRKKYVKNKPLYRDIEKHFSGKKHTGIRLYESKNRVADMQLPNALGGKSHMEGIFYPSSVRVIASNAIPTVYEGLGTTGVVFGENAYALTEDCFENGLILDALAAKILTDKGFDVGVESFGSTVPMKFQYFDGEECYVLGGQNSYEVALKPGSEVISHSALKIEHPDNPFCFRYENAKGQRFLVFNCNAKDSEMLLRHYGNAKLITDNVEWLSGKRLPAYAWGNPNLYMQCKEDGESTVIGLWNFFEDEALDPVIHLDREYEGAEFFGGAGTLEGNTVRLDDIPPYGFSGVVLKKK